ncbi:MAG: hypothetical protein DRP37_01710 [Thermodesulfobacteriota bacterium]|nr:alginate export family protein [Desulfobulbaceae bacterium]RKX62375.1 MAG: hypothetical protein DRP37_01710 [Thermodesulfobacteriota bacterium]
MDPNGSRVHQAYLDFTGIPDTTVRPGRQEIILDDARLIGNVNWRQNGQSFDAVSITNESVPDVTLFGSYINQVNTITLDDLDLDSLILLNSRYTGIKDQSITAFCYLLDTEDDTVRLGHQIVQHTKKKRIITKARKIENTKGKSLDGLMNIEH